MFSVPEDGNMLCLLYKGFCQLYDNWLFTLGSFTHAFLPFAEMKQYWTALMAVLVAGAAALPTGNYKVQFNDASNDTFSGFSNISANFITNSNNRNNFGYFSNSCSNINNNSNSYSSDNDNLCREKQTMFDIVNFDLVFYRP